MDPVTISMIIALITAFLSKKSGASDGEALALGAGAGLGTYYVATQTDWGKSILSDLDGNPTPLLDSEGNPVRDAAGRVVYTNSGSTSTIGDVLKSWGGTGTAAVLGTAGLVASDDDWSKYIPWVLGAVALVFLVK